MKSAIIGLGVIGKVHYEVLKNVGEEIVALCDIDPENSENTRVSENISIIV